VVAHVVESRCRDRAELVQHPEWGFNVVGVFPCQEHHARITLDPGVGGGLETIEVGEGVLLRDGELEGRRGAVQEGGIAGLRGV